VTAILVTVALLVGIAAVVLVLGSRQRTGAPARPKPSNAPRDMRLGGRPAGSGAMRSTPGPKKKPAVRSSFAVPLWLRVLPIVLLIGAVASLGVALTKFRLGKTQRGPVVILAIDTSRSMNTKEAGTTRLEAAQEAARNFVDAVPASFRVGLVVFDAKPTLLAPPSADRTQVEGALQDLSRAPPPGTVIGDGLAAALDEIETDRQSGGTTDAAVVLLSDGHDSGSTIPPDTATARAQELGVPVYTVVLGGEGKGGGDPTLLTQIATSTGATVTTATSAADLSTIYRTLGSTLSTELKISSSAQLFVLLAVLLAVGAAVLVLLANRQQKY